MPCRRANFPLVRLLVGGVLVGGFLTACGTPPPNVRLGTGLPVNGGFEQGFEGWGTGHIEDSVRKYHPPEEGLLPYWVSPSMKDTNSRLYLAETGRTGKQSAKIEHVTPIKPNHFGTLSQRVTVKPETAYELDLWVRAESSKQSAWFVTMVREWEPHENLPLSSTWTNVRSRFTTEKKQSEAELRFVIQGPGIYWIDDVALYELSR